MPITPKEVAKHAPRALELANELKAAFDPDGPGGKKLTVKELARLARKLVAFGSMLLVDVID